MNGHCRQSQQPKKKGIDPQPQVRHWSRIRLLQKLHVAVENSVRADTPPASVTSVGRLERCVIAAMGGGGTEKSS